MPKEETKLTVLEPADAASVAAEAESAVETAAADVEAPTGQPEPVSREEFDQLKAERDQLLDRLARLQAEFENARKRAERERIEFREYATGNVVEQFLPVLDNFELALKSAGTEGQLRSGVGLIVKQMEEILRQLQVNPVTTVGEAFDPRLHAKTCPISMLLKRVAAATSCATACCVRRWSAWSRIQNRRANESKLQGMSSNRKE
jgi:molecular chaperone GrpE